MNKKKSNKGKKQEEDIYENQKKNQLTVVSTTGYNMVQTSLPKNFFEDLLIREMELNDEFTMEKFLALVNQYSLAIEFYLEIDPMKSKAYQNRMEYLLTNKDTLVQLLRQKEGNLNENEKNVKVNKNSKELNKTMQYVKLKQEDLKFEDISKEVNKVLDSGNLKEDEKKNVKNLIENDIQKQDERWKKKYQNKKKNKLRNSNKSNSSGGVLLKKKNLGDKKFDLNLGNNNSGDILHKSMGRALKLNKINSGDINDNLFEIKESKEEIINKEVEKKMKKR